MTLNPEQREYIHAIVEVAVQASLTTSRDAIAFAVEAHQTNCTQVKRIRATLIGVMVGIAIGSGSLAVALAKLVGTF